MAGIVVQKDNTRLFIWKAGEVVGAGDKVGNITNIGDVGGETEDIDTTTIESLAREYENGFDDNGTVDITQNVTQNEYVTMDTLKKNGDDIEWGISSFNKAGAQVIGLHGAGQIKSAVLTGISVSGLLQVNSSIRVSGEIDNTFVDPIGPTAGVQVSSITVSGLGGASTITSAGGTLQCVAAVEPANATNKAVTWSIDSADTAYADISLTGLVTAKADGTATVVATAKDGSGTTGQFEVTISGQ